MTRRREILEQELYEQLIAQGYDEDTADIVAYEQTEDSIEQGNL